MKKLSTLLFGLLMIGSASAQDAALDDESAAGEFPRWTLTVKRTDVEANGDGDVYTLTPTGTQSNGADVYTATVPLDVKGNDIKPAKYCFTLTYDDGNGTVKTLVQKNSYLLYKDDTIEQLTVGAYLSKDNKIQAVYSVFNNLICDSKWRVLTQVPVLPDGTPSSVYFNSGYDKPGLKAIRNLDGKSCTEFLAGLDAVPASFQAPTITAGIYKATFDYSTTIIKVERADALTLALSAGEGRPFVAAADVEIPEGVKAYTLSAADYDEGKVTAMPVEGTTLAANTPVMLKADADGEYTFTLLSDAAYNVIENPSDKSQKYVEDVKVEDNLLVGVHQPHYFPDSYRYADGQFVPVLATDKTVVSQFEAYLVLPEDAAAPESIEIEYFVPAPEPEDVLYLHFTDVDGNHRATHTDVLRKNADGQYELEISIPDDNGDTEYFVLSDATFAVSPAFRAAADDKWAALGNIYHSSGEDNTLTRYTPGDENPTPFAVPTGYIYSLKANLDDAEGSALSVESKGTVTGVENVTCGVAPADNRIFNLFGQQVDENYKGIVIKNGRKVLVK